MIVLLNLLPLAIAAVFIFWSVQRFKKHKDFTCVTPLLIMFVVLFTYFQLQPSYMPKGEVKRSMIPSFEQREFEIKDLTPKPMSGEERDLRRKELYTEPLPFIEKESLTTDN